jgi:hypothetical protein
MEAKLICIICDTQVGTMNAPEIENGIEYGILCACGGEIKRVINE